MSSPALPVTEVLVQLIKAEKHSSRVALSHAPSEGLECVTAL